MAIFEKERKGKMRPNTRKFRLALTGLALAALLLPVFGAVPTRAANANVLVGSYSYSWTTSIMNSTDFDFTIGMGWSGPFPWPPNVYFFFHPDQIPLGGYTEPIGGAWLFEDIDFNISAAGQTFSVTSVADDPDFEGFASLLTNGIDEVIWLGYMGDRDNIASAGGQKGVQESQVFSGTDVGTDFPGWVIQNVSLTFNQIYLDPDNVNKLVLNFTVDIYAGPPPLEAEIDIDPDTLNLNSKGKWITCYIELPEGYEVNDIDVGTVMLNETVPAEPKPTEIGDYDDDGIPDLMVKFDRSEVKDILEPGDAVPITVTGALTDGPSFEGTDTIRVIDKGGKKAQADEQFNQAKFSLSQNYPNPFNPQTTIEYDIEKDCDVTLKIYNLAGQLIKTLVDEYQTAGPHTITWHGDTDAGQEVASGVYFYRIKAGDKAAIKKMVVLK